MLPAMSSRLDWLFFSDLPGWSFIFIDLFQNHINLFVAAGFIRIVFWAAINYGLLFLTNGLRNLNAERHIYYLAFQMNKMAAETAIHPPRTMMEVFNSLPEGTSIQLIENNLIMSPAPLDRHAMLVMEFGSELHQLAKKNKWGVVRVAPYDVYLDGSNAYQPDVCFIAGNRSHLIKKNGLHGAPNLVIEVLSPGTARYDQNQKKAVYERCGVTEYWIVDPDDNTATGYMLVNDAYREFFREEGVLESKLLGCRIEF